MQDSKSVVDPRPEPAVEIPNRVDDIPDRPPSLLPPTPDDPPELTIDELIARYLAHVEAHLPPDGPLSQKRHNIRATANFLSHHFGRSLVEFFCPTSFGSASWELWRHGKGQIYAADRLNKILEVFRWGSENGLVAQEAYQALVERRKAQVPSPSLWEIMAAKRGRRAQAGSTLTPKRPKRLRRG